MLQENVIDFLQPELTAPLQTGGSTISTGRRVHNSALIEFCNGFSVLARRCVETIRSVHTTRQVLAQQQLLFDGAGSGAAMAEPRELQWCDFTSAVESLVRNLLLTPIDDEDTLLKHTSAGATPQTSAAAAASNPATAIPVPTSAEHHFRLAIADTVWSLMAAANRALFPQSNPLL